MKLWEISLRHGHIGIRDFAIAFDAINVILAKGKVKQSYRKGGRPVTGKRRNVKKAYVRLAEGNSIPVFAAVEAEEKK